VFEAREHQVRDEERERDDGFEEENNF